jgi:hypothetical protein
MDFQLMDNLNMTALARTTMRQDGMKSISLLMIAADLLRQINFEDLLIGCCFTSIQKFFYYIMVSSS